MRSLEAQIAEWRSFLTQNPAVDGHEVDELENHLRSQITDLATTGLSDDEAFLVAVKRMGSLDDLADAYAQEYSGRLWKQIVGSTRDRTTDATDGRLIAVTFAVASAIAVALTLLVGGYPDYEASWLVRNAGLLVLPFLSGYFAVRQQLSAQQMLVSAIPFVVAAVLINLYPYADNTSEDFPYGEGSATELLVALHLPVVLWIACAYPYLGGDLKSRERLMDFVRFTGEWFIYYVLLALGGGVLLGLTAAILEPAGVDVESIIEWVLPAAAAGGVIVAAWLVESKQAVIENMAPVLTMVFTPLFAVMLIVSAIVYAVTGIGAAFDRELLGVFDALLIVVLGLVLYSISAREPSAPPTLMDRVQMAAVAAALILDAMVLGAMIVRIGDLGFTPNRLAALGLNIMLFVNLSGTAWYSVRLLTGRDTFHRLEGWQISYLPVFAAWAAAVVIILPPLFSFE